MSGLSELEAPTWNNEDHVATIPQQGPGCRQRASWAYKDLVVIPVAHRVLGLRILEIRGTHGFGCFCEGRGGFKLIVWDLGKIGSGSLPK